MRNKIKNTSAQKARTTQSDPDGESNLEGGSFAKSTFRALYMCYEPYIGKLSFFLLIGFIGRMSLLMNANILGVWADSMCVGSSRCRPLPSWAVGLHSWDYIYILAFLSVLGFALTYLFRVWFSKYSVYAISQLYDEITYRISRTPISFFDNQPAGRIITRFSSDYGNLYRLFGGPLSDFFSLLFDLISMTVLILVASPYYLPIAVLIAVINWGIFKLNQKKLRTVRRSLSSSRSPSIAHFAETAQGASSIRIFGKEPVFQERFQNLDKQYLDKKLYSQFQSILFALQMNSGTAILILLTGILGFFLSERGLVSIGSIGVAFGFITLASNTIQMFFDWLTQLEDAFVGLERLDDYLQQPLEVGSKLPSLATFKTSHPIYTKNEELDIDHFQKTLSVAASIEFDKVSFRYKEGLPQVLKKVSFKIEAGEKLGVIGRTGSGKSTLIQALFHLYRPETGEIRINGKTISDVNTFRSQISYIAQEHAIFNATLRENLDLAHQHSNKEVLDALKLVGLDRWSHEEDLDFLIEERGKNLSTGEKQLLSVARILLQKTPVVVLDEATASIDPQSEEILVKATEEFFKEKTQIIIAHRLSTLARCDRILWLDRGEIRHIGKPSEVIALFTAEAHA